MWWWVVGAFVVGNQMGRDEEKTKAAIKDDERLNALESMDARQKRIEQEQRTKLIQAKIHTALAFSSNAQKYVSGNTHALDKNLGFPHGVVYIYLKIYWTQYFTSSQQGHLNINGDFDGYLV